MLAAIFLIIGLTLLFKSGNWLVDGSASLARSLNLSSVVIGAVVLGFGTSAPELVVSTIAAWRGNPALGVGNIVGSNVANLSLILGCAGLITAVKLPPSVIRRQAPLSIASVAVFALFVMDGRLTRTDGVILSALLIATIIYLVRSPSGSVEESVEGELSVRRSLFVATTGLVGVLAGAQFAVTGATTLAEKWGLSGGFIGFSLVAVGTSLPELVTVIVAARKEETGLIIGNLFGSNVFNSLAVAGAMGLVGAGQINDPSLTGFGIGSMLVVVVLAYCLGVRKSCISRVDALLLLAIYAVTNVVLAVI
ncbi:MAG: sodium:calcium antiporter [Actinomycetota bacterium]|nr:sodium:calcium antiporter [Actinomycetota bacterium]